MTSTRILRRLGVVTALILACSSLLMQSAFASRSNGNTPSSSPAAVTHSLIQGSGSSWAYNAVNQWVSDVKSQGIEVNYNPNGDAQGRQDYANKVSDFGVTALGYGSDPTDPSGDSSQGRNYAYLPIAAGGTSFPYQIKFDGNQVTTLRLSGETLVKIFTNQITNWDDPEITKDNNGHALPSLAITPVVQSEGSGATAQLTRYFATEYGSIWKSFSGGVGETEFFPRAGNQIAQNGSDGAMNYISSTVANGSIGYVEYSYPLAVNYPVAKMLNTSGFYTLPTQFNVAVALEKAQINEDKTSKNYLLQNLDDVYTDSDPRTYPLSSYVYMIVPTGKYPSPDSQITPGKRQSISDFVYYSICQGQREIGPIGYSPLPVNLVEAGFGQLKKLKQADPSLDLSERNVDTCSNPTFVKGDPNANYLAKIAPQPPACDKTGAGPCAAGVTPTGTTPVHGETGGSHSGGSGSGSGSGTGSGSGSGSGQSGSGGGGGSSGSGQPGSVGTGPSGTTNTTGTTGGGNTTAGNTANTNVVGDDTTGTGQTNLAGGTSTTGTTIVSSSLAGYRSNDTSMWLGPLAAILLLLVVAAPPVVVHVLSRRRKQNPV